MIGFADPDDPSYMTKRERVDFIIVVLVFGALTGV